MADRSYNLRLQLFNIKKIPIKTLNTPGGVFQEFHLNIDKLTLIKTLN